MSTPLVIAFAATLLLGLALAGRVVLERRRGRLRRRIGRSIDLSAAREAAPSGIRLDATARKSGRDALRWLPEPLAAAARGAIDATGGGLSLGRLGIAATAAAAAGALLAWRVLGFSAPLVAAVALAAGAGVPAALLRSAQSRFEKAFLNAFPDALDLIVRALRAGLPVGEAIAVVGAEGSEPVAGVFQRIAEATRIGTEISEVLLQTAERIRVIEFRFFVVALGLQRQTGGNLAETLENLSMTIRRRREMLLKARAFMSESRASAWLIGTLPFVGAGMIYLITPAYITQLFTDPRGGTILALAIVSLLLGALTMRQLIRWAVR